MNEPFELHHIREFGDGCALYEAKFNRPMTVGELMEYAVERKRERGYIHISGTRVFEFRNGRIVFDDVSPYLKEQTIEKMVWYGGFSSADYIISL